MQDGSVASVFARGLLCRRRRFPRQPARGPMPPPRLGSTPPTCCPTLAPRAATPPPAPHLAAPPHVASRLRLHAVEPPPPHRLPAAHRRPMRAPSLLLWLPWVPTVPSRLAARLVGAALASPCTGGLTTAMADLRKKKAILRKSPSSSSFLFYYSIEWEGYFGS